MSIRVYGIKNCNTMKKTFSFLDENGLDYEFIDYKKQAPDEKLLSGFADKVGFEKLINQKGTTYRKLSDEQKSKLNYKSSAIQMLIENSSMIKRPVLIMPNGNIVLGFEPEEILENI